MSSLRNGLYTNTKKSRQANDKTEQPINWHDNVAITDIHVPWLYEAHSLILLAVVIGVILYFCFTTEGSIQLGLGLNVFFFIAVGCLIFPAGPFIRPHPIFWRLIFSISLLYSFFLLFLLSQTANGARTTLRYIFNDDRLGYQLPEKSYAVDCSFELEVVWSVCDRFLFAHFIGWAVRAAIVRDRGILWVLSVLWEIVELATKYFIPNFAECWWDQLILDVLICNGLGIEVGLYLTRKWYAWYNNNPSHQYLRDWAGKGLFDFKSICLKFQRLFVQLTPTSLTPMYWEPLSNLKRFYQIHLFIICSLLLDINAFLLKLFLFVPTEHSLNIWRLGLITLFATVSSKQYYLYLTNEKCKKLGSQTWITIVIIVLELSLSFKCAPTPFPKAPMVNKICCAVTLLLYFIFTYVMFRDLKHVKMHKN